MFSYSVGWAGFGHNCNEIVASLKLFMEELNSPPVFVQEVGLHRGLATEEAIVC